MLEECRSSLQPCAVASAPSVSSSSGAKIGSIVGGVAAAVVILAAAAVGAVFVARRKGVHPSLSFQKVHKDRNGELQRFISVCQSVQDGI